MASWKGRIVWNDVFKLICAALCLIFISILARSLQAYWDSRIVEPHRLQEAIALDKCKTTEAKRVLDNKTVITVGILANIEAICEKDPNYNLDKQREIFVVVEEKRNK